MFDRFGRTPLQDAPDYDERTALHLSASEGHVECVRWLLARGAKTSPTDRFGGTPLRDAEREGRREVAELIAHAASA